MTLTAPSPSMQTSLTSARALLNHSSTVPCMDTCSEMLDAHKAISTEPSKLDRREWAGDGWRTWPGRMQTLWCRVEFCLPPRTRRLMHQSFPTGSQESRIAHSIGSLRPCLRTMKSSYGKALYKSFITSALLSHTLTD
jgi:hypothetical protein